MGENDKAGRCRSTVALCVSISAVRMLVVDM
jgi:hypothetical protein